MMIRLRSSELKVLWCTSIDLNLLGHQVLKGYFMPVEVAVVGFILFLDGAIEGTLKEIIAIFRLKLAPLAL